MFKELELDFDFSKYRNYKKEKRKQKIDKLICASFLSSIAFLFCFMTASAIKNPSLISQMNDAQSFSIVIPTNETLSEIKENEAVKVETSTKKINTKKINHNKKNSKDL
jgi:hypothetical protein